MSDGVKFKRTLVYLHGVNCSTCPCLNVSEESLMCNLGYVVEYLYDEDEIIVGCADCGIIDIRYSEGVFVKPEVIPLAKRISRKPL